MQNDIQKATIPGQGRVAFKLRATEFLYKKRRYPTNNALMTDLSPLTFFSHIAHLLHVCERQRPWLPAYLHRLSVVALLEFEMCRTDDKAHLMSLAQYWQAPSDALIAFVRQHIVPSEPTLARTLLSFHQEVQEAVSLNIVGKLATL